MSRSLLIKSYSRSTVETVKQWLSEALAETRYAKEHQQIFQICDELIKNAIKANYKFLLLWQHTRERLLKEAHIQSVAEADEWLREAFYSGEDVIIRQQIDKLPDSGKIIAEVRHLLDLESKLNTYKDQKKLSDPSNRKKVARQIRERRRSLMPLMALKRMARDLRVFTHFKIDTNPDKMLITVSNDAPLLKEDMLRIQAVRDKFQQNAREGEIARFFTENLDTSGGGHGLGYALMDCTLLEMGLEPNSTLYLISANKAMVLLSLPLDTPA